jgi:hypothetical protein
MHLYIYTCCTFVEIEPTNKVNSKESKMDIERRRKFAMVIKNKTNTHRLERDREKVNECVVVWDRWWNE